MDTAEHSIAIASLRAFLFTIRPALTYTLAAKSCPSRSRMRSRLCSEPEKNYRKLTMRQISPANCTKYFYQFMLARPVVNLGNQSRPDENRSGQVADHPDHTVMWVKVTQTSRSSIMHSTSRDSKKERFARFATLPVPDSVHDTVAWPEPADRAAALYTATAAQHVSVSGYEARLWCKRIFDCSIPATLAAQLFTRSTPV